ncbi:small ribosomal subunit protein eS4, X isoform-like [Eubalaena glacialis]|uniref:small ribosomal subunit protein eS4, X isoform-like n=1 Tax=Eubalaena glacialis TaxID=27606 RepID=UPI002A59B553|nr:small ribosomal subunit protein eS4, X isoform-like [Eubalaena glacialis]
MVAQRKAAVSSGVPLGAGVSNVCCTQALAASHGAAQPVYQACQAFRDNNSGFGLFRIFIYDTKGRFAVHRITPEEAKYKLCKVRKIFVGTKGIPHLVTHDARTIRYPDPLIKVNDTIQIDLETGKITDFIKFDTGNLCMVTGGANLGRIGVITSQERHPGSFDVVHVKDANGNSFATRLSNIFVIGKGNKPWISLPREKGIRLTIAEERDKRLAAKQSSG